MRRKRHKQAPRDAVLYMAARADAARAAVPPWVMARLQDVECRRCRTPLVAVADAVTDVKDLARRRGLVVVIACVDCAGALCEGKSVPTVEWLNEDLAREIAQWQCEQN